MIRGCVEIAEYLGCSISTLYHWHRNDPRLAGVIQRPRRGLGRQRAWLAEKRQLDAYLRGK